MQKTIKTSHNLNANPDKIWKTISKASGVNQWLPITTSCSLEGKKRVCRTEQGDLKETILKINHDNKIFKYAIDEQPLLPIQNVIGTSKVIAKEKGTELEWNMDFDLEDENQLPIVKQAIEGLYQSGANGLENISQ